MHRISLGGRKCVAAIFVASICLSAVRAQVSQPQRSPALKAFFQALIGESASKTLPSFNEAMRVIDQTGNMPAEDVADALPAILEAWKHSDDSVKDYAGTAIFAVSERPDGAELLRPYSKAIGGGLDYRSGRLQGATVMLLARIRPEPGSDTISLLVTFVKRKDRNPLAQADALSLLLRIAPDRPDLTPALEEFLARPMDDQTRDGVINDIANSHTENIVAADFLTHALQHPTESVRFQAAQAFQRMPKDMVLRAKPALDTVVRSADEAEEVKNAASEALKQVEQSQ